MKAWVVVKNTEPGQALALKDGQPGPSSAAEASNTAGPHAPTGANILIRVTTAALNPADLQFMKIFPTWLPFRRVATPGLDFVGEIVQLGPAAAAVPAHADAPLTVGTRVAGALAASLVATGHGTLAEYLTVPADLVVRPPKNLSDAEAAGFFGVAGQTTNMVLADPAAEAIFARRAPRVLVNGASGGVGALVVQAAKGRGAAHVVGVCSAANTAFVRSLGADDVVDYKAVDLTQHLAATYTGAQSFDLIVDCVGDQALFRQSAGYLAPDGAVLCIVGGATMGVVPFVVNKLLPKALGGTPRLYKIMELLPTGARARAVAAWVDKGILQKVPVDSEYVFADAAKAYEKLSTKRAKGKIVIKVQE